MILRKDGGQRGIDSAPFRQQLLQDAGARLRAAVEALVALPLLPPLADEEALRFETAQQRIEGALVDLEAVIREQLAERVAVLLGLEGRQDGQHEAPAPELQAEVVEAVGFSRFTDARHSVWHIVYVEQYIVSRSCSTPSRDSLSAVCSCEITHRPVQELWRRT